MPRADASRSRTGRWTRSSSRSACSRSCAATPTCSSRTSIIESGIDIPQANTLIVDRADIFGLAQLYQIRGRVGRSRERAYAYLLYPSAAALTQEAATRLAALSDYTELGAGFKVAMRDLELRGAGNLLGDEQSGHVAALGFELYMQMLDEAVQALGAEGEDGEEAPEPVRLDVNVDAYVPADYIPYEQAKIDVHRRIAGAREVAELGELRDELEDRFGELPEPLENLITLQQARIKLGQAGAHGRDLPRRPARGHARSSSTPSRAKRAARADPRARSTSRASRSSRCACPTIPRSASRRWCRRPTRCSRCSARRPRPSCPRTCCEAAAATLSALCDSGIVTDASLGLARARSPCACAAAAQRLRCRRSAGDATVRA